MGSSTPNLGLYKPDVGESTWGSLVNQNWDALDSFGSGGDLYPASALTKFVDPVNGSDSNNGRSVSKAMLTPAAAVADLQSYAIAHYSPTGAGTLGIGRIHLLAGADFDLGTGLVIDYRYPVEILGYASGYGYVPGVTAGSPAVRIKSSSSAATEMIKVGSLGTSTVGYGFAIRGVTAVYNPTVNTAMTAILRLLKTTRPKVHEFYGITTNNNAYDVPLIEHDGGSTGTTDGASFQFLGCVAAGLPLLHAKGGNLNRGLMGWCECQFGVGATYPMVWLDGAWWSSTLFECALEGGKSGPAVKMNAGVTSPLFNSFINNGGEAGDSVYPFYDIVAGAHNIFDGGGCSTVDASLGDWIKFGTNAYPNKIRGAFDYTGAAGYKRRVVDNSTYPAANQIDGLRGRIYKQKSGAAPTYSSSDFPAIPPDGTIVGTTFNTGSSEKRLWAVINGAYCSVVLS